MIPSLNEKPSANSSRSAGVDHHDGVRDTVVDERNRHLVDQHIVDRGHLAAAHTQHRAGL